MLLLLLLEDIHFFSVSEVINIESEDNVFDWFNQNVCI